MKLTDYKSYMHCQQCGHDLKRVWRYPYGIDGGKYCLKCAAGIQLTRARKIANIRQPASIEYIHRLYTEGKRENKAGKRVEELANQFEVSPSYIRTVLGARR